MEDNSKITTQQYVFASAEIRPYDLKNSFTESFFREIDVTDRFGRQKNGFIKNEKYLYKKRKIERRRFPLKIRSHKNAKCR